MGEVWFEEDSQSRIINYLLKNDHIEENDRIIDLGTGNGILLVELAREGFKNLTGADYSEGSIELATNIAKDQDLLNIITYKQLDLLSQNEVEQLGKFKVVNDKGTYDAISLNPEDSKGKRLLYLSNVSKLLDQDGIFIITSCNWTEAELVESFKAIFVLDKVIETPKFKFGGSVGSVVTSLVFKHCSSSNV